MLVLSWLNVPALHCAVSTTPVPCRDLKATWPFLLPPGKPLRTIVNISTGGYLGHCLFHHEAIACRANPYLPKLLVLSKKGTSSLQLSGECVLFFITGEAWVIGFRWPAILQMDSSNKSQTDRKWINCIDIIDVFTQHPDILKAFILISCISFICQWQLKNSIQWGKSSTLMILVWH